jgi:uncharacterized protein
MRTTLAIDDDVLSAAKAIAHQKNQTIGRVVSELARRSLRPPAAAAERNSVPLLPVRRPDAIVTLDIVNVLRDESSWLLARCECPDRADRSDPCQARRVARWFAAMGAASWATCPLTENGVIHIVGHPNYPNSAGAPAAVLPIAARLRTLPGHVFLSDDFSLLNSTIVDVARIATPAQVTDTYLLALAVTNKGHLATFDRRLWPNAVRHGRAALHVIRASDKLRCRLGSWGNDAENLLGVRVVKKERAGCCASRNDKPL